MIIAFDAIQPGSWISIYGTLSSRERFQSEEVRPFAHANCVRRQIGRGVDRINHGTPEALDSLSIWRKSCPAAQDAHDRTEIQVGRGSSLFTAELGVCIGFATIGR